MKEKTTEIYREFITVKHLELWLSINEVKGGSHLRSENVIGVGH